MAHRPTEFDSGKVKELMEKTRHYDADERFMATKDLLSQMKLVSGALDPSLQPQIRDTCLRLLDDRNSDVSTMGVKCLSQLSVKFAPDNLAFIANRLADIIVDGGEAGSSSSSSASMDVEGGTSASRSQNRDIVTDALQTMLASMTEETGAKVAAKLVNILLRGLTKTQHKDEIDVEMAGLTIIKHLLDRFGSEVSETHKDLIDALLKLLEHPNEAVRKRASVTLGPLVVVLDDASFSNLMSTVISCIDSSSVPETYIQSVSAVCRSAGVRVGKYLDQIVPKLEKFCMNRSSSTVAQKAGVSSEEEDERQVELWETSLQALEAITLRCPGKVTAYVPTIVQLAIQLSTYDPMYSYESEEAEMARGRKASTDETKEEDVWSDAGGDDDGWGEGDGDGDSEMADAGEDGWDDDEQAAAAVASASSDNSWKVRRAAVALLAAFIRARSDILSQYYTRICEHLVERFKERDLAVKEDIIMCTRDLLRESVVTSHKESRNTGGSSAAASASSAMVAPSHALPSSCQGGDEMDDSMPSERPSFLRARSSYERLPDLSPRLIEACLKLFNRAAAQSAGSGSMANMSPAAAGPVLDSRTTRAIFALLRELVRVRQGTVMGARPQSGVFDKHLSALLPHILRPISSGRTTTDKETCSDSLKLLQALIETHSFDVLQGHLNEIARVLADCVSSGMESNKVDALAVIAALSKLLPRCPHDVTQALYDVVYKEFLQQDVPINLKLATLSTLAALLAHAADEHLDYAAVSSQVMPVLLSLMRNDSTVQPALRALTRMANHSSRLVFGVIVDASTDWIQLVRKSSGSHHHLRNDVVRTMGALIRRQASKADKKSHFNEQQIQTILNEITPLISDADPHLTHLVMDLVSATLRIDSRSALDLVPQHILPLAIQLVVSPRLQGVALASLIKFFQACVESGAKHPRIAAPLQYKQLLSLLLAQVPSPGSSTQLSKGAYASLAQCLAGITLVSTSAQATETVARFVTEIVSAQELGEQSQIALLVLGEIGRKRDLTSHEGLQDACLKAFDSPLEMVRSAAAFALGNIGVGNLANSLPMLLKLIQTNNATTKSQGEDASSGSNASSSAAAASASSHGYLLFSSLKEIISTFATDANSIQQFKPYFDQLTPTLLASVENPHEATRVAVAECIGRLLVIDGPKMLSLLEPLTQSPKSIVRACIITSMRFCLLPTMDFAPLYAALPKFIPTLLHDPDLEVRRQTLLSLNALARSNVECIPRDLMYAEILPTLYKETEVKQELVREVDYGAFKKTIDDGKPLRRAAFQALQTLLEVTPHRLDLPEFLAAVKLGLRDPEIDIQQLTYSIFIELAKYHGPALLEIIEQLPKIIMSSVKKYIAEAKSKEPEQALDVLRSIVRALLVFNTIPGVEQCASYAHFYKQVCATTLMAQIIQEMVKRP